MLTSARALVPPNRFETLRTSSTRRFPAGRDAQGQVFASRRTCVRRSSWIWPDHAVKPIFNRLELFETQTKIARTCKRAVHARELRADATPRSARRRTPLAR